MLLLWVLLWLVLRLVMLLWLVLRLVLWLVLRLERVVVVWLHGCAVGPPEVWPSISCKCKFLK